MGIYFRTDVKLTMKLFDTLINPILLYGSEIWGVGKVPKSFIDPIESVERKFCKLLLGTDKTASNNACRAELGRFTRKLLATRRCLKYWTEILERKTQLFRK